MASSNQNPKPMKELEGKREFSQSGPSVAVEEPNADAGAMP